MNVTTSLIFFELLSTMLFIKECKHVEYLFLGHFRFLLTMEMATLFNNTGTYTNIHIIRIDIEWSILRLASHDLVILP